MTKIYREAWAIFIFFNYSYSKNNKIYIFFIFEATTNITNTTKIRINVTTVIHFIKLQPHSNRPIHNNILNRWVIQLINYTHKHLHDIFSIVYEIYYHSMTISKERNLRRSFLLNDAENSLLSTFIKLFINTIAKHRYAKQKTKISIISIK